MERTATGPAMERRGAARARRGLYAVAMPAAMASPANLAPGTRRPPGRGYLLAAVVLLGSLLLVAMYARSAIERERRAVEAEHLAEAERISTQLLERLLRYELALRGGVSLFSSVARPTEQQWRGYVGGLNISRQFPGLAGLGYSPYLSGSGLEALQLQMRDAGKGLFEIRPTGVREFYGPILYLDPADPPNREAIGYDMFSHPDRNRAMAAARDSGQILVSAPLKLLQQREPDEQGLLMYAPVYAGGVPPLAQASRRESFTGWVYAPFGVDPFVRSVLRYAPTDHALRIVDVTDADGKPLYRDPAFEESADPARYWSHSSTRDVYGRKWRMDFQAPRVDGLWNLHDLKATLVAGGLASVLLFAVVLALAHTQGRAERIAARMSESWRRSELRFRSAMEYSAVGNALLDGEGRIVEANPALERILGTGRHALAGQLLDDQFVDGGRGSMQASMADHVGAGSRSLREVRRPDGEIRHVDLVYAPVPGETGTDIAVLAQVEDITARLQAEEQMREMNRLLEARVEQRTRELTSANRDLESFAYSVSHDLRAPLRTVYGFARILMERHGDSLGEEGRDHLGRIRRAANRMDELIDALLKMSRISRDTLQMSELDLSRIAAEVAAELQLSEPERQVEFRIQPGLAASGDAVLVRGLLQNLLGNAWKFTRDAARPVIEFALDPEAEGLLPGQRAFLVRDNGAGFDPAYADKLFRPFQRLHSAESFPGHGIGLASVKRILERHGGGIRAEAAPGEGATFRFTLPAAEAPPPG